MVVHYSPKPQYEYMMKMPGKKPKAASQISLGLGDPDIIRDPALWNYCSLTSRLLYLWEDGNVKMIDRPVRFPDLGMYERDLENKFKAVTIREYMVHGDPREFLSAIQLFDCSHLELRKFYKTQFVFEMVVRSRVLVWEKSMGIEPSDDDLALIEMIRQGV